MIDRNVEFPNRFRMTLVPGTDDIYEVVPAPGDVIAAGDTFSKVNMLPDSIPALLGLKMANPQVKDALNVLANVGNLHVWERVQTYAEPVPEVPAGYTLGEVETDVTAVSVNTTSPGEIIKSVLVYYANEPTVYSNGNLSIDTGNEVYINSTNYNEIAKLKGKFISVGDIGQQVNETDLIKGVIYYIPSDSIITYSNDNPCWVKFSKIQRVTGYPYTPAIPAGTTTDYLTSTDRNAYPDNVTDAQDAYYTLEDVVTGKFGMGMRFASSDYIYSVASEISVADDGTISLKNPSEFRIGGSGGTPGVASDVTTAIAGKYIQMTQQGPREDQMTGPFSTAPSAVLYIPSDVVATREEIGSGNTYTWYFIDRYQPVTGHAAIPANTTITYLGQLGGGARIEVVSYVGTGTYGSSNKCSISFNSVPKMVFLGPGDKLGGIVKILWPGATEAGSYYNSSSLLSLTWSDDNKTVRWYSRDTPKHQCNTSGQTYRVYALI